MSAGNPLPSFNSRAYVYAGLDQPVLRGYFDGTDGSTSPDGGYQVYPPDGLGSVMGVLVGLAKLLRNWRRIREILEAAPVCAGRVWRNFDEVPSRNFPR